MSKIYYGQPPTVQTTVPYAVIYTDGAENVMQNTSKVRWAWTFRIIGRFAFTATATDLLDDVKEAKANALHNALITGASIASVAFLPKVERVSYSELDGTDKRAYEIEITFTCQQEAARV